MKKQMTDYAALVDTTEDKGGNKAELGCPLHYFCNTQYLLH